MKKILKIILVILLVWVFIFLVDFAFIKINNNPIFMFKIKNEENTNEYIGLGYKFIKCSSLNESYFTFITSKVSCSVEIEKNESDAIKFTKEYSLVSINNVFVYRNIDEIINILNNGTGIIYLGFPDCKWCQAYVPMLNQVAIENNLSKIYYFNIYEDRKNNSIKYKEIVDLLQDYLQYDDEGNKRIYVPAIIAVKNGEIVGFDDETSYDTKGYDDPSVYWKEEGTDALLDKLSDMISKVNNFVCTDCNK